MKNLIKTMLLSAALVLCLCSCNRQMVDITYSFDRAIVSLPDGSVVSGKVDSWRDFADGDQIQVTIDRVTYLVHSSDVALIKE